MGMIILVEIRNQHGRNNGVQRGHGGHLRINFSLSGASECCLETHTSYTLQCRESMLQVKKKENLSKCINVQSTVFTNVELQRLFH